GPLGKILGTPETIQPGLGLQWLVLGRITYDDGSVGALLVVKPRRMDAMPFDMVAYADRNADFPQQTTGDQFFDEAQWESYHQLGLIMGEAITPALIAEALSLVRSDKPAASSLEEAEKQSAATALAVAKTERSKRAGVAVRATVGAGLSLSLLVAAWQGFEQYRETRRAEQRMQEERALSLVRRIWAGSGERLIREEFVKVQAESAWNGDDRFAEVVDQLAARCEAESAPGPKGDCIVLLRNLQAKLKPKPEPFYDYW